MQNSLALAEARTQAAPERTAGPRFPAGQKSIHAMVEWQAARRPDAIAAVCGKERITYRDLNERANQLAHRLRDAGVRQESLVGLLMDRSVRTVIGILGVLKAGGCYVPIDL